MKYIVKVFKNIICLNCATFFVKSSNSSTNLNWTEMKWKLMFVCQKVLLCHWIIQTVFKLLFTGFFTIFNDQTENFYFIYLFCILSLEIQCIIFPRCTHCCLKLTILNQSEIPSYAFAAQVLYTFPHTLSMWTE